MEKDTKHIWREYSQAWKNLSGSGRKNSPIEKCSRCGWLKKGNEKTK